MKTTKIFATLIAVFASLTVALPSAAATASTAPREGPNSGEWKVEGNTYTVVKRPTNSAGKTTNDLATYVLGNTDKKVTVTAKVKIVSKKADTALPSAGGCSDIIFGVSDINQDGQLTAKDELYMVTITAIEDGPVVDIERYDGKTDVYVENKQYKLADAKVGDEVIFSATYDPATATISVSVNGEKKFDYTDPNPLKGTGYGIGAKITGGTFSDVSVDAPIIQPGEFQLRENGEKGKYDMRLLFLGQSEYLKDFKDATVTITFTKSDGGVKKTKTMDATADKAYKTIKAKTDKFDETYTAREGYGYIGLVVKGIGTNDVDSFSAKVTLNYEGGSVTYYLGKCDHVAAEVAKLK